MLNFDLNNSHVKIYFLNSKISSFSNLVFTFLLEVNLRDEEDGQMSALMGVLRASVIARALGSTGHQHLDLPCEMEYYNNNDDDDDDDDDDNRLSPLFAPSVYLQE